jgi:pyroglutamyl-peptidase
VDWAGSAETIQGHIATNPADGVLVIGVAVKAEAFRVEALARNAACQTSLDAHRQTWPGSLVLTDAPATLAVTAPFAAMVEAIGQAGLPVESSEDAGDYLCNFTLYRLLHAAAAPAIGFLHIPQARECDPAARFGLDQIALAVQAAADAFAMALARPAAGAPS